MKNPIIINLISVKEGKNKYWLSFTATCGWLNNNRVYTLEFCGTDLEHSLSLSDSVIDNLKQKMVSDFGYAPYNIDKCKSILGNGIDYILNK